MSHLVVTGPPLAGKTTYAKGLGLPYLDWDEVYAEVSGLPLHERARNDEAIRGQTHKRFREAMMAGLHTDTTVVRCAPLRWERDMYRLTKGVKVVLLEVPHEECLRRLEQSGCSARVMDTTRMAISLWWRAYQPSPHDIVQRWEQVAA